MRLPRVFEIDDNYPVRPDPDLPFPNLNPLQSAFKDNYDQTMNTVVESGTGTGKTAVHYIAARPHLEEGKRIIITAPTRELVKSLYRDSVKIWGAKIVGINTGSDKDVAEKFFIVSTPEGYISAVRSKKEWCNGSLLIVDEAHNIMDASRGGELDVAIAIFLSLGGTVLLTSGTFPCKRELAQMLKADLFISKYRRTRLTVEKIHAPDDFNAGPAPKKPPKNVVPTLSGHVYSRESLRLNILKEILRKHEGTSVIVFVPTKAIGFCLEESLVTPFHCADIEEKEKDRLVTEFNRGNIKTILATNTLSEGVNTPADIVIVFGTRRGSYYLDTVDVNQMFGRAGRGKDEATAYLIGDKIELFHAMKQALDKTIPLPVESMTLTVLSTRLACKSDVVNMLRRTYAATFTTVEKVQETVERYLHFLSRCNILTEKDGRYSLTKEGALLARYYISPRSYMKYIGVARKLKESTELQDLDKGCILVSCIINFLSNEAPPRLEKDIQMKLIPLELDKEVSPQKSAVLRHCIDKPSAMPPPLVFQLRDVDRWLGMLGDIEKYKVREEAHGKAWLHLACVRLKTSAVRNSKKKKPVQLCFPETSAAKEPAPIDSSEPEDAPIMEEVSNIMEG
ncbi:MAG: DEAD/DEAH box helicase [Thermodesulfovibrionales bacterium]